MICWIRAMSNKNELGAMVNIDAEVLLEMTDEPLVCQSEILIAESTVTMYMTPNKKWLVNIQQSKESNYITMGNCKEERYSMTGDFICESCFDGEEEWRRVRLTDVTLQALQMTLKERT